MKEVSVIPDYSHGKNIFELPEISTKLRILRAVTRPLDRITITEICEQAGISRQTFYRHFQSKYDIPSWHAIFCRQFYLDEIGRTIDWRTGYYHHLRLVSEERNFYRQAIQYQNNVPYGYPLMLEHRQKVLMDTLENYRHIQVTDNLRFLVEVYAKLECEVIMDWFRSDAPTDLTRWTDDLVSLVPHRLYVITKINEDVGEPWNGW